MWSSDDQPHASTRLSTCASTLLCVATTPLGVGRGAAGVENHGGPLGVDVRQGDRPVTVEQFGRGDEAWVVIFGERAERVGVVGMRDQDGGLGVVDLCTESRARSPRGLAVRRHRQPARWPTGRQRTGSLRARGTRHERRLGHARRQAAPTQPAPTPRAGHRR